MTAEAGHHANRFYGAQDGSLHINGAAVYDDNEVDISDPLNMLGLTGSVEVAADALAIPVTHPIVLKTTGADAEALTLADGTLGQVLTISLVVDGGGTGTLTPATATGWATIVFADAGDVATLKYVDDTTGWIILALYGLAAQPAYTLPA